MRDVQNTRVLGIWMKQRWFEIRLMLSECSGTTFLAVMVNPQKANNFKRINLHNSGGYVKVKIYRYSIANVG